MSTSTKSNKQVSAKPKQQKAKKGKQGKVVKLAVRHIRGKGDYIDDAITKVKNVGKKAWDIIDRDVPSEGFVNRAAKGIGNFVGSEFGVGRQLGNAASYLARIFGMGDYTDGDAVAINHKFDISHNSFMGSSPPTFAGSSGEDVIISRREFVKNIKASNQFAVERFFLNPGNPALFPWLAQFAKGYEEYQILGMVFEFKSTSSDAVSSGLGMGSVVMATDYDCLDAAYTDKRTMAASEFSNSCKPSVSFLHPIECDPRRNVLGKMYVLPGITDVSQITPANSSMDPRFATLGQTYIAVEGMATADVNVNTAIGELWVSYKVKLSRPVLEYAAVSSGVTQLFKLKADSVGNIMEAPTVVTKGGVGFSIDGVIITPNTAPPSGTRLSLRLNTPGAVNVLFHYASTTTKTATTTWSAHNNAAPLGNVAYEDKMLTPLDNNSNYVMVGSNSADINGDAHRSYTGVSVCIVPVNGVVTLPVFINTTGVVDYTAYVVFLPSFNAALSRVHAAIDRVLSEYHTNAFQGSKAVGRASNGQASGGNPARSSCADDDEESSSSSSTPETIDLTAEDYSEFIEWKRQNRK